MIRVTVFEQYVTEKESALNKPLDYNSFSVTVIGFL